MCKPMHDTSSLWVWSSHLVLSTPSWYLTKSGIFFFRHFPQTTAGQFFFPSPSVANESRSLFFFIFHLISFKPMLSVFYCCLSCSFWLRHKLCEFYIFSHSAIPLLHSMCAGSAQPSSHNVHPSLLETAFFLVKCHCIIIKQFITIKLQLSL